MLSASELHQRGFAASSAGRHATARKLFEKALTRSPDHATRARIELSLAYTEAELDTVEQGLARCRHALTLPDVPRHVQGLIWSQIGLLHMRAGDGTAALEALDRAAPMIDPASHEALGALEINRGNVYLQRGEPEPAITAFKIGEREFEADGDPLRRDKAVHNLGYAYLLTGDLVQALQLMDRAHDSFVELGPVYEAVGSQDRAEALIAAGMPTEAMSALRAAAEAFARRRMRKRQAEALLVLARLLLQHDPREGMRVARRAARLFTGNGSTVWALRASAVALEARVLDGADAPGLVDEACSLADDLRDADLPQDAVTAYLYAVRSAARRGDLTLAHRCLEQADVGPESPLPLRLLDQQVEAELDAMQGDHAAVARRARGGLAALHEWQATFGSLDLQSSLVGHGRGLARLGLRAALEGGRPADVFEWAERARALATRVVPVRPEVPAERVDALRRLRELLIATPDRTDTTELRSLRQEIRESAWQRDGSGVVAEPMQLDEVQAELGRREGCVVAHLVSDDRLHALVVTPTDARVVPLGGFRPVQSLLNGLQADLDVSAAHLPAAMRDIVLGTLYDRLARLADLLVAPLAGHLDGRRVALVASGPLIGVPWHLLDGLRGLPMTLPRSVSALLREPTAVARDGRAVLVAGPHVPRAQEEVTRAAAPWARAETLTGDRATTDEVAAAARDAEVLHLAAHGRHSADNPLFAGVQLQDGMWFGYDIDALPRVPGAVVLSACELGRSTIRWAEEAVGMPSAWLHAGARVVIASPASVDDDVACEVLAAAHTGLARGDRAADALADATGSHGSCVPSTFTCIGAGW